MASGYNADGDSDAEYTSGSVAASTFASRFLLLGHPGLLLAKMSQVIFINLYGTPGKTAEIETKSITDKFDVNVLRDKVDFALSADNTNANFADATSMNYKFAGNI